MESIFLGLLLIVILCIVIILNKKTKEHFETDETDELEDAICINSQNIEDTKNKFYDLRDTIPDLLLAKPSVHPISIKENIKTLNIFLHHHRSKLNPFLIKLWETVNFINQEFHSTQTKERFSNIQCLDEKQQEFIKSLLIFTEEQRKKILENLEKIKQNSVTFTEFKKIKNNENLTIELHEMLQLIKDSKTCLHNIYEVIKKNNVLLNNIYEVINKNNVLLNNIGEDSVEYFEKYYFYLIHYLIDHEILELIEYILIEKKTNLHRRAPGRGHQSVPNPAPSPDTSESNPAPSPDTSESNPAPSPDTSESNPAPSPDTSESNPAPSPDTSESNPAPSPDTSESNPAPSPDTSESNPAPSPDTSESNPAPSPDTSESNTAPSPDTSESNPAPSPDTSESNPAPSPIANNLVNPSPVITQAINIDEHTHVNHRHNQHQNNNLQNLHSYENFLKLFQKYGNDKTTTRSTKDGSIQQTITQTGDGDGTYSIVAPILDF
uniref:Uncharacterized protein n=1 Tax=viral metagenome TaxID=1070528 RepID=A0A6C0J6Y7_9ZZZZ